MRFFLAYACVVLTFMVPGSLLLWLGLPGAGDGGNVLQRIHPVSYIFVFSFLLSFLAQDDPEKKHNLFVYYACVAVGCWWMLYGYFVNGQPATVPLVSFICPFLFLTLLVRTSSEERAKIGTFIHAYIVINALIALWEYTFHTRLIPMEAGTPGSEIGRSSALLGHPLTAAAITGAYILAIFANIRHYKNIVWPFLSIALCLLAMATYGGRTAMAAMILCGGLVFLKGEWMKTADGTRQMGRVAGMFVVAVFAVLVVVAGFYAGLFDVFIDRVFEDHGSGYSRVVAWDAVWSSTPGQFLFGRADKAIVFWNADFNRVDTVSPESFWLNVLFYNGLVVLVPVTIAFLAGLYRLSKEVSGNAQLVVLYFLICISGSVGLGGKVQILAMIFTIVIALCEVQKSETVKRVNLLEDAILKPQG